MNSVAKIQEILDVFHVHEKLYYQMKARVVRMQLEFQVSFSAIIVMLSELEMISTAKKSLLFDRRDALTSRALFRKLDAEVFKKESSDEPEMELDDIFEDS